MAAILDATLYEKCLTHQGTQTKLYVSSLLLLIEKNLSYNRKENVGLLKNTSITPAILPVIFEDIMIIYAYKFIIRGKIRILRQ